MKFYLKHSYDDVPYLESEDGLWDITYDDDKEEFVGLLSDIDLEDAQTVRAERLEDIVPLFRSTFFVDVEIPHIDQVEKTLKEGSPHKNLNESTTVGAYTVETDFSVPYVSIKTKKGEEVYRLEGEDEVNSSVEEFSSDSTGDDDTTYEEWILDKYLSEKRS